MIKAVQLNSESEYIDAGNKPLYALYDLDHINIFIGANNCGKSRLVRRIFNSENTVIISDNKPIERIGLLKESINGLLHEKERSNLHSGLPKLEIDNDFAMSCLEDNNYYELYKCITKITNSWFSVVYRTNGWESKKVYVDRIANYLSSIIIILRYNSKSPRGDTKLQNSIYIPTLRGIENFDSYFNKEPIEKIEEARLSRKEWGLIDEYASNSVKIYQNKISKAYTIDPETVFTAENLYEDIRAKLLGHEAERNKIASFQKFISDKFYDDKEFTLIPIEKSINNKKEKYIAVKIGSKQERRLYDLGDGIKQLITILYPIYMRKDQESYFFIEEPEINLHPGYQTKLVDLLNDKLFYRHQFFIVTHSNHLLSSAVSSENTSVYKVSNTEKPDVFRVVQTSARDLDIINTLGAKNSSMLMANCAIFIEGISDKIYLKKYLQLYFEANGYNYKEDIHYTFVETGGANIAHWSFVDDIGEEDVEAIHAMAFSKRSFVICDNDGGKKKKRKEKLEKMVGGENFHELPVREIENLLKREILEKVLFGNNEPKIKKEYKNNRKDGYAQKYLGGFIDEHYDTGKKYSASKYGTINDKLTFARKAASFIRGIDDMSPEALELCEKITAFIDKSNK